MSTPFKMGFDDSGSPVPLRVPTQYGGMGLYLSTRADRLHKMLPISAIMSSVEECTTKSGAVDEEMIIGSDGKVVIGGTNIRSLVMLFIADIIIGAIHITGMDTECSKVDGEVVETRTIISDLRPFLQNFLLIDRIRTELLSRHECVYDMLCRVDGNLPGGFSTSSLTSMFNVDKLLSAIQGNTPEDDLKSVLTETLKGFAARK
jgi:hypothetical protein